MLQKYKEEGGVLSRVDKKVLDGAHYTAVGGNLIGAMVERKSSDMIQHRSLIRHDSDAVAKQILKIYKNEQK